MQTTDEEPPSEEAKPPEQACVELFPGGGFIVITDEVFNNKPYVALEIIRRFIEELQAYRLAVPQHASINSTDLSSFPWRLCVRPELMPYIYQKLDELSADLGENGTLVDIYADMYDLLSDTDYIEQDGPLEDIEFPTAKSLDGRAILSKRREVDEEMVMEYFDAASHSQEEANYAFIQHYADIQVILRWKYRHFYVVHIEPLAPCARQWREGIQTIADVLSPEQFVEELEKSPDQSLFDFRVRDVERKGKQIANGHN